MDEIDAPICISQYFVNKHNLRSFGNIIKWSVWRSTSPIDFCTMLFGGEFLVNELSTNLLQIFSTLKTNIMSKCKEDFKQYFPNNVALDLDLMPVSKEYIFTNSWKALNEIIPKELFGCNFNAKIFKNFCLNVIYSMKRQHFIIGKLIKRWDLSVLPWRHLNNPKKILYHLLQGIFRYILAPIICLNFYVTTCKLDADENKLYYFWKNQWHSFYDKQISKMIYTKVIKKCELYSFRKKTRHNHSHAYTSKLLKKDIPKLHLTLKPNNECRPIVCYKNNMLVASEKYKIRDRLRFLRSLAGTPVKKIENLHEILYHKWIKANKPRLYFIKTDLSNAFGSINREKLAKILSERYTTFLKKETCVYKRKKIAQQFKDIVTELHKPILIRAGSTVYEWKEGLVQGYKYSPALSELYYNYLDEIYFSDHINNQNHLKLFTRVVDDYLYITDTLDDALLFLESLSNYRNVNYEKTIVNFPNRNIKMSEEITFLGYCYNTTNMQVSRASNIYTGQICYKIAFTSGYSDLPKFLESRIGQTGIQINSHIFNLQYNSEELVWKHIFTTFCLSANKLCTILAILCEEEEMTGFLALYKNQITVKLTISMLNSLIRNKPKDLLFVYCINHFRYLSWLALYFCAKLTPKCSGLIPKIQIQLAKSNCIFGLWREHASRIDAHGNSQQKAMKDVCRRNDLRMTFKNFQNLPQGFECYHHRRLK